MSTNKGTKTVAISPYFDLFHPFKELRKGHIHCINEIKECDKCDIFITSLKPLQSINMCFGQITEFSLSQSIVYAVISYEASNIFKSAFMVIWDYSF